MEPQHHLSSARRLLGAVQGVTFQETWMVPRPEGRLEEDCGKPRKKKKRKSVALEERPESLQKQLHCL